MIRLHLVIQGNSSECAPTEYSSLFQLMIIAAEDDLKKIFFKEDDLKKIFFKEDDLKKIFFREDGFDSKKDDLGLLEEMSRFLVPKEKLRGAGKSKAFSNR